MSFLEQLINTTPVYKYDSDSSQSYSVNSDDILKLKSHTADIVETILEVLHGDDPEVNKMRLIKTLHNAGLRDFYHISDQDLYNYISLNRYHIHQFLHRLHGKRCLSIIHEDLDKLSLIEQNPEHHAEGNAFVHTALVCYHVDMLSYKTPTDVYVERIIASLFHDIGKIYTHSVNETGIHHYGHEKVSTEIVSHFCSQLEIPSERIVFMVSNHMRVQNILKMKSNKVKELTDSPYWEDLRCLALADYYGAECKNSNRTDYIKALENDYGR